jgi:hypothetical protein
MLRHDSMLADIGYFGFSVFVYGFIFGWRFFTKNSITPSWRMA